MNLLIHGKHFRHVSSIALWRSILVSHSGTHQDVVITIVRTAVFPFMDERVVPLHNIGCPAIVS